MAANIADLRARAKSPGGIKAIKYTLASAVSVVVSIVAFVILKGFAKVDAVPANVASVVIGGIPNYYLNRRWAWGKTGKSHLWKEIVPFWALAFIGLGISTGAVALADSYAKSRGYSHVVTTLADTIANLGAFGVLWIGKFLIFNKLMFGIEHHSASSS
jgi:putative flippase GtrA